MFFFLSESEKSQHLLFCRVSMAQGIVQQFGLGEMACTICGDKVVATPPKVRQVMANYYSFFHVFLNPALKTIQLFLEKK